MTEPVRREMTPEARLAHAMLLFYSGGEWSEEQEREWRALTGHDEATTKALGDLAREVIGAAPAPPMRTTLPLPLDLQKTYLGDGLWLSFDGWGFDVLAPRSDGEHYVTLEPETTMALLDNMRAVLNKVGVPQGHAWQKPLERLGRDCASNG